jgi:DNA-binding NarL/FixJ family response regulator
MADDHHLVRDGLKRIFDCFDDVEVKAEATSGDEVLAAVQRQTFDLILLDVSLPGLHGVDLIAQIVEHKRLPVLMLSMFNDLQVVRRMLRAGASGYITKDSSPDELIDAVRKVAAGGKYLARDLAEKIAFEASSPVAPEPHETLTEREMTVLRMLAKGVKMKEIAADLGISNKTVSAHKARIMQKMHITNDAKLMQYAVTHSLV